MINCFIISFTIHIAVLSYVLHPVCTFSPCIKSNLSVAKYYYYYFYAISHIAISYILYIDFCMKYFDSSCLVVTVISKCHAVTTSRSSFPVLLTLTALSSGVKQSPTGTRHTVSWNTTLTPVTQVLGLTPVRQLL